MAELEVELSALRDMAGRLKGLKNEFESQDSKVSGFEDALGAPEVAGALDDFANNWSDKRKELAEMLEQVAGYATLAADAYTETEHGLSENIEQSAAASASHPTGDQ